MRKSTALLCFSFPLALLAHCGSDNSEVITPPVQTTGATMGTGAVVQSGGLVASGGALGSGAVQAPGGGDVAMDGDAGVGGDAGANTDAGMGDASVGMDAAMEPDAFSMCVDGLMSACSYDTKETACSSVVTAEIPLTDGSTWGNIEVAGGPYGAIVEWNEGADFANPVALGEFSCDVLAGTFGEPASVTAEVLDLRGADLSLYTIFRPACMKDGETYPVITWGNGTCGQTGGYGVLLATLASHGYVVVASNSRFTNGGNNEMRRALDLAESLNADSSSPLYGRLDMDRVGAMGHSQGASATRNAASDPRIKSVILWNGGSGPATKPYLIIAGDRDIGDVTAMDLDTGVQASSQPAAWAFYHKVLQTGGNVTGHLTLMMQPERVWEITVAWWDYMLSGDEEAKKMFVGDDCGLCNQDTEFEYGANSNLP